MSVRAWIADKMRRRPKSDERFQVSSVISRLEEQGFKPIIKSDILESRVKEIRENLNVILQILGGNYSVKTKGVAVDEVHTLLMTTASPWLRSMDNPWLAHKVNCFLELYAEFRYIPEYLGMLITCATAIINMAMCNIDVEPLTPILISPGNVKETRVIQEGEERHSSKREQESEIEE
jgi:hypothetical protein